MDLPPEFAPGQLLDPEELRRHLRVCGAGVKVYRGCRILPPGLVSLGEGTQIDEGVMIFAGGGVEIGRRVHLAFGSSISGGGTCRIGDFAGIGAGTRLITGSDNPDGSGLTNPTIPPEWRSVTRGHLEIGAHALLFTACVVFPGVAIGEGAVAAAGSLVHKDLKPWTIYAGNPLVAIGVRPRGRILELARSLGPGAELNPDL